MQPTVLPEPLQRVLEKKRQSSNHLYSWGLVQQEAASHLQQAGLPGPKSEDYRHSPAAHWLSELDTYGPAAYTPDDIRLQACNRGSLERILPAYTVTLRNGCLYNAVPPSASPVSPLPYQLQDFTGAEGSFKTLLDNHFSRYSIQGKDPFAILNTALFNQGTFVYIPDHTHLDKPLWIDDLADATIPASVHHPRLLLWVGKKAQASFIHHGRRVGEENVFTNRVVEMVLEEGAHASYYNLQFDGGTHRTIHTTSVYQASHTTAHVYTVTGNSQLIRNNVQVLLQGSNSHAHLYGLYKLVDGQRVDNQTIVDHQQPGSTSYELYKGIIMDQGVGVFNGKIYVRQPAQQTNAFQRNDTWLLSPRATMHTKPQLEIWADDVRCSHGATVGQVDPTALFYLQSRGIPAPVAQAMLMDAFANEVIQAMNLPLLQPYVREKLLGHSSSSA